MKAPFCRNEEAGRRQRDIELDVLRAAPGVLRYGCCGARFGVRCYCGEAYRFCADYGRARTAT